MFNFSFTLEVMYFTLYLMSILQAFFLGRNGEKSLLMSHLNKTGWVNTITYTGYMEYLKIEMLEVC